MSVSKRSFENWNGGSNMDRLLPILACPKCKGSLAHQEKKLVCAKCRLGYKILEGGIPNMLIEDAEKL